MLIVKVYVNTEQIDEIQIHRETPKAEWGRYHVEGYPELGKIRHKYALGYKPLLRDALNLMIESEQE